MIKTRSFLRVVLVVMVILLPARGLLAQALFANTYGGSGDEWAYSLFQTADGGYVMAGPTSSYGAGGYDFWISRLDASGNFLWQKTYGGSSDDIPNATIQTSDGGYIMAGRTSSFGAGGFDALIVRLDSLGYLVWYKIIGGSSNDMAYSIQEAADGSYFVSGWIYSYGEGSSDYWIFKLNSSGDILWQKSMGGIYTDCIYSSCLSPDGGIVVAGGGDPSFSIEGYDIWVVKLDGSGNVVWQRTKSGSLGDDIAFSINPTSDGGYIIAGFYSYAAGVRDFWVIKLNSAGNEEWNKIYGGNSIDWAFNIRQTPDGGYLAVGRTDSFPEGDTNAWLVKLDPTGEVEWQKTFGGSALDYAYSLDIASDGSYLVGGVTASYGAGNYDAMLLKLEPCCFQGNSCPLFSATAATSLNPYYMTILESISPQDTYCSSATTTILSSTSKAVRAVQCAYPLPTGGDDITLTMTLSGDDPVLNWTAPEGSCSVTGYGVYRGTLPFSTYDHESLNCSVADLSYTDSFSGNTQYYLVVPNNPYLEGSYGFYFDGAGLTERPPASASCRPQCLLPCL